MNELPVTELGLLQSLEQTIQRIHTVRAQRAAANRELRQLEKDKAMILDKLEELRSGVQGNLFATRGQ